MAEAKLVISIESEGDGTAAPPPSDSDRRDQDDAAEFRAVRQDSDETFESASSPDVPTVAQAGDDVFASASTAVDDLFEEAAEEQAKERSPVVEAAAAEASEGVIDVYVTNFDELDLGKATAADAGRGDGGGSRKPTKDDDDLIELPALSQMKARAMKAIADTFKGLASPLANQLGFKFRGVGIPGAATSASRSIAPVAGGAAGGAAARGGLATSAAAGAGMGAPLAIAGVALVGLAAAAFGAKKAFDSFSSAMQRQVEEIKGFSAEVATASAQTALRRLESRIGRAQQIGPQVAQFEDFRSRLEQAQHQVMTQIYSILLELFEFVKPALEQMLNLVEASAEVLKALQELAKALWTLISNWGVPNAQSTAHFMKVINALGNAINAFFDDRDKKEFDGGLLMRELEAAENQLANILGRPPLLGP